MISNGPGFTGFFASLHAEQPSLGITLLRVRPGAAGLRAARRYAAAAAGQFRELSIDAAGRLTEPVMVPADVPGGEAFPLGPGDVVLVSRSAGGAGLALAQVLACCGTPIAVVGCGGPGEDSEVVKRLDQLHLAGARVAYELIDVSDPAGLAAATARIERKLGPVTAVGHTAADGRMRLVSELTEAEIREHAAAGAAGLRNLVASVKTGRLRLIATFGSVIGRYGMAGESLLALSSGSLAGQAQRLADAIPGCRAMHVDWPGWSGSVLGERADLAAGLARAGIRPIGVEEGSRLLLKMLATPVLPARITAHGRVGLHPPAAIAGGGPQIAAGARGRFLQFLRVHYPGVELVSEARLALSTDPYLAEHRVDGIPVLPAVMALEAMAQAASALAGRPVRAATGVSMIAPVVVPAGQPDSEAVIRICVLRDGETIRAAVRCAESGFTVDHFRAAFRWPEDAPGPAGPPAGPGATGPADRPAAHVTTAGVVDGDDLYGPICFQAGRFRRVAFLPEVSSRGCRALVRGSDDQPWFGPAGGLATAPLILGSPGLNDATMHMLQACVPHRRLLPAGCDAVTFSGIETDGMVEISAVAKPADAPAAAQAGAAADIPVPKPRPASPPADPAAAPPQEYAWDVDAVDTAGNLLVSWRGLRLRDAGALPRNSAWPPSLLSVYLERSAVTLGLDGEIRVSIRCERPGTGAAPPPADVALPRPTRSPAGSGTPDGRGRECVSPGGGGLEGFALHVQAGDSPACSWQVADPAQAGPAADPRLAGLRTELARCFSEPRATLNARLRAIADCLPALDPLASHIVIDPVSIEDWMLLHDGGAAIACTVAEIRGVALPVAIALATGGCDDGSGPLTGPGQRSARAAAR